MKNIVAKLILKYLQALTRFYVKKHKIEIYGLTGSMGKTTLTLALYNVLSKKYKVGMTFRDGHGLNSESGIPFALLDVKVRGYSPVDWFLYLFYATINFIFKKPLYSRFIIEMGVDKPGDMDFILSMTKPDLGIFLSISNVHTENFEHMAKERGYEDDLVNLVFEEKAKLVNSLDKDGWAVLNYDNILIRRLVHHTDAQTITFGLKNGADVRGKIKKVTGDEFSGIVQYGGRNVNLKIQSYFVNKKIFSTLLATITVGITEEISLQDSISAIKDMTLPPGRMSKIDGIKDTLIIDSSYNSSREALFEALDNLALFEDRRRIAVLGDMRELGSESKREHEIVAAKAIQVADTIILVGKQMKKYFLPEALKLGYRSEHIHHFVDAWKALKFLKAKFVKHNDVILVKGSQNTIYLEIIVEGLMEDKSKSDELLCRRGKYWEKKRNALK